MIEQRAEFELDESNGTLAILPRNVPPAPALTAFQELGISDAARLQREMATRLEEIAKDPDVPFGPFQPASFRGVLETCAARLDASGTVLAPEEELGAAGEGLRISPTFCVLVRPRRGDIPRDDIRRLIDALSRDTTSLPETARRFVLPPPDAAPDNAFDLASIFGSLNGSPSGSSTAGAGHERAEKRREWLFFPLPANEEQEEIARRLEQEEVHGVVVQGPPGTGKTHTIANIIGHSMAKGRRVLVAAHTAEALTAIREKLPQALRNLAIAVTHRDREGARQLEEAVSALAQRAQSINPREAERQAQDLLRSTSQIDERVGEIDAELAAVARANLSKVPWRGAVALPQHIAAWTAAQGERHAWFPDRLDLTPQYEPRFGEGEIAEARSLRRTLGEDLRYCADDLPSGSEALPGLGAVLLAHRVLRGAAERREKERDGSLPRPDLSAAKPGELTELLAWLERLATWRDGCPDHAWMPAAWEALAGGRPLGRLGAEGLRPMLEEAARLAERGAELALHALELLEVAEADRLAKVLANLAAGRRAFGFFGGFGRNPVKDAVEAARVAAEPPRDALAWAKLAELHAWRRDARGFVARWNAFAAQHGLSRLPEDQAAARDALGRLGEPASEMLALVIEAQARLERLRALFPYGLEAEAVILRIDVSVAVASLRANMGDADLAEAERLCEALRSAGDQVRGPLGEALRQMADGLGTPGIGDAGAAAGWRDIQAEVDRLTKLRDVLHKLSAVAAIIRGSGAERWAAQIEEPPGEDDPILPAEWRDAWDHARATGFLARIADRTAVQKLTHERAELTAARERQFLEAIELLTYLGLRSRLTDNVLAALNKFLAALARLPKTPGAKTAVRQRRILRDSLQRAVKAIPCWIMPEWRVAEQLPPELGGFDLVIIDEASQSNIMALPVVLRGKKLLIVGDDQQVSPAAGFIEDAAVNRLRITYLTGQPLAEQIDPATSLYELGGMMYPGKVVCLREHFRCVEPIIRFSSRFYGGRLVPLRLPKPSERLDPPLVDIFVEDGRRRGDVNEAEADVVTEEIKRAIADSVLNASGKRSIGVISLHADKQAKLIYDRLIQAIGPEAMSDHHIMCGDAATFQGQERDIVFLSMVHDENTASKQ
ncbi:MAG: ATP-binding protein [Pseudomonadota bacterium]|nr:ATP-binding protein [Pseudomonadota bacterium]